MVLKGRRGLLPPAPPPTSLATCRDIFNFHNSGRRVLLASGGQRPEKLLNILQCTGKIPTRKNYLAQDVNSTQFNKSHSWPSFFLLLESGNTPSPQTPSPHTQRHQDLTRDQARCSIWWSEVQSAGALQAHQLWLPLLLAWASRLTLWNSLLKKREKKKIYTVWIIPNLIRLWWTLNPVLYMHIYSYTYYIVIYQYFQ